MIEISEKKPISREKRIGLSLIVICLIIGIPLLIYGVIEALWTYSAGGGHPSVWNYITMT